MAARIGSSCIAVLVASLASCAADPSIAPSYPGTLVLVADDAAHTLLEIEPNGGHVRHAYAVEGPVVAIAIARNGQYAATIDADGDVVVCDLARQGIDAAWHVQRTGRASGLVFADRRSTLLAAFDGTGELAVLSRESGRQLGTIVSHAQGVQALARTPDGRRVALISGSPDGDDWIDLDEPVRRGRVGARAPLDALAPGSRGEVWSHARGETTVLFTAGSASAGTALEVGPAPLGLAVVPEGVRAVATCAATGELVLLDGTARTVVARVNVGPAEPGAQRAWPVIVDPDSRCAFVSVPTAGRVVVVDLRTHAVRGAYEVGGRPGALAWTLMRAPPEVGLDAEPD